MTLQIMQNIYPASWFYLTWRCYVRSMFVKHLFVVAVVVCLFCFCFLFFLFVCSFNWYKLDCKLFYRAM